MQDLKINKYCWNESCLPWYNCFYCV